MKNVFTINMKLPSLNEYINLCRTNKYKAAKFKADIEADIALFLTAMPRYQKPVKIHFHWIEGSKRRDLDNICFAKKFILDAMVKAGKLKNDNRKCVTAFTDSFYYGKEAKVILEIEEVTEPKITVDANLYDKEEIHHNCTVQVLENTFTGKVSVGWWENEEVKQ